MKNVIITGADGFIGYNTTECFLKNGCKVLAIDILDKPKRIIEKSGLTYKNLDVGNIEELFNNIEKNKYDTFIHLAWIGSAGQQRTDYKLQMTNAITTVECMKVAKKLGCKRFVCAGSIMEKEVVAAVNTQGSNPGMGYIYGMGKLMAHHLCKAVAAEIGIDLIWPMITNAYGVGELSPRFVNSTLRKIINKEPLKFTSASQNYDFVYIDDVAKAFYLISKNGKPFHEYMIGSSSAKPLKDFILEMINSCDKSLIPTFGDIPFTGTNMPICTFDTTDTEKDTGFKASISFAEGTKKTMDWLKSVKEGKK